MLRADVDDESKSASERLQAQKQRLLQSSSKQPGAFAQKTSSADALERRMISSVELLDHMKHLFSRNAAGDSTAAAMQTMREATAVQQKKQVPLVVASRDAAVALPPSGDLEPERAAVLRDLVHNLRRECTAWTKELLYAYPQGTFDAFFASPVQAQHQHPGIELPVPPPEDIMLAAYHANADAKARDEARRKSQDRVAETFQQIQLESRWHLGKHVTSTLDHDKDATLRQKPQLDTVRVLGMAGACDAPADLQVVQQTVHEAHALSLLMHVMNTASIIDTHRRQGTHGGDPHEGSRGSSETPSVTTIASLNDPTHASVAMAGSQRHDVQVNIPAGATSLMRTAGLVSAISSVFSPGAPIVASRGAPQNAFGGPISNANVNTSALVAPKAAGPGAPRSIQFQDSTVDLTRASSTQLGDRSPVPIDAAMTTSTSHSDPTRTTTSSSRDRTSDPTSGTVHDTSTAATAGVSDKSATRQPHPRTNVWGAHREAATNESSESAQAAQRSASQASSTSKKKKKGLFSCVRRADSDDSD